MRISPLFLLFAVVSCNDGGCKESGLTRCQKIEKTLQFVRNQKCEGGGVDIVTQGSYLPASTPNSIAGETVRQTRYLSLLSEADFNNCLPINYTRDHLCTSRAIDCGDSDSYPTFDGTCNNIEHPEWGSIGSEQRRLLPPVFNDDTGSARLDDKNGQPLPNPRTISNEIFHQDGDSEDTKYTLFVTSMAQLADHDITLTPTLKDKNGDNIDCCKLKSWQCSASCLRIPVPENDPHFSKTGQTCINFVRSASSPCCSEQCKRTPLNMISSYIDGTPTYGNSAKQAAEFREKGGKGAKLKVTQVGGEGAYLPKHPDQTKSCIDGRNDSTPFCVISGDSRSQVVPFLTSIITMFHREHNRIVDKLHDVNPKWDDERLYQEARKIVRAIYQKIIINDLIAGVVLDDETVRMYGLKDSPGYSDVYNDTIHAQMAVGFSTAAFRFGHTLIPLLLGQYDKANERLVREDPLHDHFDRGQLYFTKPGAAGIMRYLGNKGMGKADSKLAASVRNNLFLLDKRSLDLGALNIMRGRDHGLPSYNAYRKLYRLDPFPASHDPDTAAKIRHVYNNRDDEIDLFVGGLSELKKGYALVGPLFAAMIGDQFAHLKNGDRFYHTNPPNAGTRKGRFRSEEQVRSIQDVTLARVVCANTETAKIQPNIFIKPGPGNEMVSCDDTDSIKDIDFELWKEG